MGPQYDLVVRGGLLADGSGGQPFETDVAINDATIKSGVVTYREGSPTDARPGRLVRNRPDI